MNPQPHLIRVSKTLAIRPEHIAFAEWKGPELVLHFAIPGSQCDPGREYTTPRGAQEANASNPTGYATRTLTGDEAKTAWAALLGGFVSGGRVYTPAKN